MANAKKAAPSPARASAQPAVPRALSLHIGLNAVNPLHYSGWSGELHACEFDAREMKAIAKSRGMKPTVLLTKAATRAGTLKALRDAAGKLVSGDFFFLTYSGHGGQMPDVTGEEADRKDETWCLYDGELIDDELHLELAMFERGVRILVLSDSCHSGTVVRAARIPGAGADRRPKFMPPAVAARTYRAHRAFYDMLQEDVKERARTKAFRPALILISGCRDDQVSMDGETNGAFTEQLLRVWDHGAFAGSYAGFHSAIKAAMTRSQTPHLSTLGRAARFVAQAPFKV
jgi:hypothetical protein